MSTVITRVKLQYEQDVVYARYRARIIAEQLGFDKSDQTRISTAVSEIARNVFQYTSGGEVEFLIDTGRVPNVFMVTVRDQGKGSLRLDEVLGGRSVPATGVEQGITATRRLMDHFRIDSKEGITTIVLGKNLPTVAPEVTPAVLTRIADMLVKTATRDPIDEIRLQNQEYIQKLEELRPLKGELDRVNRELDETNRGVVALYIELDDKTVSLIGANRALRESEEELKRSATLLNDVSEMAQVGGWELDVGTREIRWTQETYRIHEIDGDEKIDLQKGITFYDLPGRSTMEAAVQHCIETEEPFDLDLPLTSARGRHLWVRAMGRAVKAGGKVVKVTGTFQDITERKAADETIRTFGENLERQVTDRTADLSDSNLKLIAEIGIRLDAEKKLTKNVGEKEALLREVHHRVKNNLQIIISLLNLQSRYMTDKVTLSAFRESQNRIKVMALVHEKLYQSTNLEKIDLDNYIKFLGTSLFQLFGMSGKGITFTQDIRDVSLAIDTAIPVGLIINELISNSLKYAFPEGRKGEVSLAIRREDHTLTILFRDNGVGIPEDFDWRNAKSLGLRLIITLVDQLDGTIELDRRAGTAFTIVVKEKV